MTKDTAAPESGSNIAGTGAYGNTEIPFDFREIFSDITLRDIIAVTLYGIPKSFELSAGTDMGGGTWGLQPSDLQNLALVPSPGEAGDFEFSISAVYAEGDGDLVLRHTKQYVSIDPEVGEVTVNFEQFDDAASEQASEGTVFDKSIKQHIYGEEDLYDGFLSENWYLDEMDEAYDEAVTEANLVEDTGSWIDLTTDAVASDVLHLDGINTGLEQGEWRIMLDNEVDFTIDTVNRELIFDKAASGHIVLESEGKEIVFNDIERVEWN